MRAILLCILLLGCAAADPLPEPVQRAPRPKPSDSWKPLEERGLYLVKEGIDQAGHEYVVSGLVRGDTLTLQRTHSKYQGPFIRCLRTAVALDVPRCLVTAAGADSVVRTVVLIGSGERLRLVRAD